MKYKAVLFDLDDTLLKTAIIKWAHHKAVAKQFYNIDLTDEVLGKHWGMPFEQMVSILYQNADGIENMLKANASLEAHFLKEVQDDSIATVNALLHAGMEIGVVTSMLGYHAQNDLIRLGFPTQQFFLIQGAENVEYHKPDPRVFHSALTMLAEKNIAPCEVLYVGDALMDFYAARDADIGFLGVTTGFITQQQFADEGATAMASLNALLEHLTLQNLLFPKAGVAF